MNGPFTVRNNLRQVGLLGLAERVVREHRCTFESMCTSRLIMPTHVRQVVWLRLIEEANCTKATVARIFGVDYGTVYDGALEAANRRVDKAQEVLRAGA